MDAETIEKALEKLGELALKEGKCVEMAVYGGSALALAYDLRISTKDVDAIYEKDKDFVRKASERVAAEMGLPKDWLNDAVKGYASPKNAESLIEFGSFPSEENPGLKVFVPSPEYFFAMKCVDIRTGATSCDVDDVKKLALVCGIGSAREAMDIVESFYSDRGLPPKTRFALEEIFDSLDMSAQVDAGRAGFKEKLEEHRKKTVSEDDGDSLERKPKGS